MPGKPDESELVRRSSRPTPTKSCRPPDSNKQLKPEDKELLQALDRAGGEVPNALGLRRAAAPALAAGARTPPGRATPIDHFILARLEAEGLQPSPEADKTTLIRRLTLDLTGLPPTPAEVDAFLADTSDQAYERLVDRLLATPHYGERMALDWLDAARFADTHGYHIDSGRDMTRWREWVIDAFNRNLPFDQFTDRATGRRPAAQRHARSRRSPAASTATT